MRAWPRRFAAVVLVAGPAGVAAHAQEVDAAAPFGSPVDDDRVYGHALLDELEGRFGGGADPELRWEAEAWVGTDTNRLWFKSEAQAQDGRVRDGDQELLYARPVSAYFDLQAGVRYDLDLAPGRGWAALGVEGLTPYFFNVSVTAYASDGGHFAARAEASRDLLLTQRLILQPAVELNAYTRADPARDVGAGISKLEAGLRLRYEISRKFAPYAGVVYERVSGPDPAEGYGSGGTWRLTAGVRAWW